MQTSHLHLGQQKAGPRRRAIVALCIAMLLPIAAVRSAENAAEPVVPATGAGVSEIVQCAQQRTSYNMKQYPGYSVRLNSRRQSFSMEGKAEDDYRVVKTIKVAPGSREETFERGEKNGKAAEVNDFWMEKLGLSKKYNAENLNLFSEKNKSRYDFALKGAEQLEGRSVWRLAFKIREEGEQELQKGDVWLDQKSCGVVKATGAFPEIWVTESSQAEIHLQEVKPGLWLPSRQVVDIVVDVPLLAKRRARMTDEFSSYAVKEANR